MNKILKRSFVIGLALLTLVGCGSKKSPSSDEKVNLTVWVHPYVGADKKADIEVVYANMTEEFKKTNPNATVTFEEIPWANREQKFTTTLAPKQGPDIFYLIPDQVTQFADKDLIANIDEFVSSEDRKGFSDTSMDAVTYKDKLYGLPILRESQSLFYNKKILEEIGADVNNLPKTWKEFNELGAKAVEVGYYARTYDGGNTLNSSLYPLIWQAGGDIANDKNEVFINNEKSVKAFEQINQWYKDGFISKDSITVEDSRPLFLEGKVMAAWGANNLIGAAKENNVDFVIGSPLKEEVETTFGTTGAFVVSNVSENKEKAVEFLKIMTNEKNMMEFNTVTGFIPARESALSIYDNNPK
ncbi:extracellular solute-binding protein [Erysipelothrix sp. D19-032]